MKQRARPMHIGDEVNNSGSEMLNKKDDDLGGHLIPLHKMRSQEHFIEAQIQEGDSLQAIALRFYCSISELKRINHIHKDNEIFARRTIKVPITPYSVLTELTPAPEVPTPSTSNSMPEGALSQRVPMYQYNGNGLPEHNISINNNDKDCEIDCNTVVMNSTLAPSVIPYIETEMETISEDTQLLQKIKEPVETVVVKQLTSQGADFGLKWFHLLCCVLILGVVIPLVYVMFFLKIEEHDDIPPLHST